MYFILGWVHGKIAVPAYLKNLSNRIVGEKTLLHFVVSLMQRSRFILDGSLIKLSNPSTGWVYVRKI